MKVQKEQSESRELGEREVDGRRMRGGGGEIKSRL